MAMPKMPGCCLIHYWLISMYNKHLTSWFGYGTFHPLDVSGAVLIVQRYKLDEEDRLYPNSNNPG